MSSVNNGQVKYSYLADGTKLRVRNSAGTEGFDYLGSLIYRCDASGLNLESVSFGDGRIVKNSVQPTVQYFQTDHLGSIRTIVDGATGSVLERNDYYPFGSKHIRTDYALASNPTNRFLFNGKEKQVTGGLNFLDYGWRMYDEEVGRWFGTDKMAEKYYTISPFVYCANEPLKHIDPDGKKIVITNNKGTMQVYNDLAKIYATPIGRQMIIALNASSEIFTIKSSFMSNYIHQINVLRYNPNLSEVDGLSIRSFEVLGHELRHAYQDLNATNLSKYLKLDVEKDAIMMENYLKKIYEGGGPLRIAYGKEKLFNWDENPAFSTNGLKLKVSDAKFIISNLRMMNSKRDQENNIFKREDSRFEINQNFIEKAFEYMNNNKLEKIRINF